MPGLCYMPDLRYDMALSLCERDLVRMQVTYIEALGLFCQCVCVKKVKLASLEV